MATFSECMLSSRRFRGPYVTRLFTDRGTDPSAPTGRDEAEEDGDGGGQPVGFAHYGHNSISLGGGVLRLASQGYGDSRFASACRTAERTIAASSSGEGGAAVAGAASPSPAARRCSAAALA